MPSVLHRACSAAVPAFLLSLLPATSPVLAQCDPAPELCDGIDNDCDGSVDEVLGTRYVALTGSDADNLCTDPGTPCRTIGHAVLAACAGETVSVGEGTYVEDVTIDRAVFVDSSGSSLNTKVQGTGAGDVVTILASDATWNGLEVTGAAGVACVRVGSPAVPGVRNVTVQNGAAHGCGVGVVFDSTGSAPGAGWNRLLGFDVHHAIADGSPYGGTGVLVLNGNGRLEIKLGSLRENDGAALRVEPPAPGASNATLVLVGENIYGNGSGALATSRAALEVYQSSDVRIEGNDIHDNVGLPSVDDGRGAVLDQVSGGNFFCNRLTANDGGLVLAGGTSGVSILHNRAYGQTGTAVLVGATSSSSVVLNENLFSGNLVAVENQAAASLDAQHNWWGAASGPSGAPGGSGDAVVGPVDVANFIARAAAPVLVRRPTDSGWDYPVSACRASVQSAVDTAVSGDLLLVGEGQYPEHVTIAAKPLDLEGVPGGTGCSPSEIYGIQSNGSHLPALRISDVANISLANLTLRGAGHGTTCGQNTGDEIGLDLQNVSDSAFSGLCLRENGVTELRLYGDCDRNVFDKLDISGMIRDEDGDDLCGHRSREAIRIDGAPACEGGPGAIAEDNRILDSRTYHCSNSVRLRLTRGTEIRNNLLHGVPAPAWGELGLGVWVEMSDDTQIVDNPDIGNLGMKEAIRVQGRSAAACATEELDSERTLISGNTITRADWGIRLYRNAGDPGAPVGTQVLCNAIGSNVIDGVPWPGCSYGVQTDHVGTAGQPQNLVELNDISGNTNGLRNLAPETLSAIFNWWGSDTGPGGGGPGSGDSVTGAVGYAPWLDSSPLDDADGDTLTECDGDADDTDPLVGIPADPCDGLDNDEDGTFDEDFIPHPTWCGVGACAATGVTTCVDGEVQDTCVAGTPTAELCDGIDNDCNSATADGADEGWLGSPCDGPDTDACSEGTYLCSGGAQACNDTTGDSIEVCNGLDDDCDGSIDDGFDIDGDLFTSCGGDCDDNDPQRHPGVAETCDGVNNDCDPLTIDGSGEVWSGQPCDGPDSDLCTEGAYVCRDAAQACTDESGSSLDLCDGTDNDCDPSSADGSEESWIGQPCDGTDADLCLEGVYACVAGAQSCDDPNDADPDLCDGVNNDCNPVTLDGAGETWYAQPCDGPDSDLCTEGVFLCTSQAQTCTDDSGPSLDLCDGTDNDCDPASPDGAGEAWFGQPCDGTDADLCLEGVSACVSGAQSCDDPNDADPDLCDGVNNDCDPLTLDGTGESWYAQPCDGPDSDLCTEGAYVCRDAAQACTDESGSSLDLCDGTDNDCDPSSADGSEESWIGQPCDGTDADLCLEGVYACVAGAQSCDDPNDADPDLCDGVNNDCNPVTLDGAGETWYAQPCDGPDSDLCTEGVFLCTSQAQTCTDDSGPSLDLCDGTDNDCDPASPDGAGEAWFGQPCDGTDADLCLEGVSACVSGAQSCDDPNDADPDLCDGVNNDCDPLTLDGSAETWYAQPCDGPDIDLCIEGAFTCQNQAQTCTDETGSSLDLCDGVDNDCNPASPDGAGESWFGQPCDGTDADLCLEGVQVCVEGAQSCDDPNDADPDLCDGVNNDCNPVTSD
ncbi:MAG: right-handed parallel beta-helix repeat-containing protein, partial [Acidobacteria bacterium]|nr:right-handed parallel beta-helix repeat-containing protein [Acidobacteriota bacterium]